MVRRSRLPSNRLVAGGLAAIVSAGCYTNRPLTVAEPAPGTPVSLVLSDQGRVAVADSVGPSASRVQGTVVRATDGTWVVAIADVVGLDGRVTKWSGETVGFRTNYVAAPYERRFSKPKTILMVSSVVVGVGAVLATLKLVGLGGILFGGDNGGGGNNQ
ncbi:MAG: hypothetical protein DMD29_06150 [Gemmatimonadetes bacterium]|nr:MAG: hypothetical protein DMD29_06150 [Gemmatimonadota bacterium]